MKAVLALISAHSRVCLRLSVHCSRRWGADTQTKHQLGGRDRRKAGRRARREGLDVAVTVAHAGRSISVPHADPWSINGPQRLLPQWKQAAERNIMRYLSKLGWRQQPCDT